MREGWKSVTLGSLCTIITKGTTPTSLGYKFSDEGINFIKIESISLSGQFIPSKFAYISEEAHIALKRSQLLEGDILFSIAGALGRTALISDKVLPANTNQALAIIRLRDESIITKEYLLSVLATGFILEQIEKYKGGVAQQNLSLTQIKSFEIPIPPLPEQKQIVKTLDLAFGQIDQAKANLEQNLANAKELFASKLNEVFSQRGEGWEEKRLVDVTFFKSGTTIKKDLEKTIGEVLYIKVGDMNLEDNQKELTTSTRFVDYGDIKESQIIPIGSVVFPKRGGAIATNKKRIIIKPTIIDLNTMAITPKEEISMDYFFYWFKTIDLVSISSGTSIPQINNYSFKNMYINYPKSLSEQKQIVKILDELSLNIKTLQTHYQQNLNNLEELKKSILEKAFKGEL